MKTRELARFVAELRYEDLPETTVRMAKQCILDSIGNCIRGSQEKPGRIMQRIIQGQGGNPTASVLASPVFKTTAMNAALLNGCAMHSLDYDDLHNASIIHLGTVVVPAALAVAEETGTTGKDLILAVAAGYEVGARAGEAVNPESYFFWHTTATAGTFGAAAAAAKLIRLGPGQTLNCFGSAGTQAAGLWEFLKEGAMSKTLHAGKAAMNGIFAALLAREGFTAASRILEGEKGFCHAMTLTPHLEKLTEGLGSGKYKIDENSFKPYACCKHCHPAVNAALVICAESGLKAADIDHIVIRTNAVADNLVNNPDPQNSYGSKFSIQYCTAAAIRFGKVGVDEFGPGQASDPMLRRLMANTEVAVDAELDADFRQNPDRWSVWLMVTDRTGRCHRQFIEYPKGDPQNPMTYAETEEKVRSLANPVLSKQVTANLLQTIAGLDSLQDVGKMF